RPMAEVAEERKVYSVRAFNFAVARRLDDLPTIWIEGEVTELRRQDRWATVYFTLKDPENGACLPAQMPRGQFDSLELGLAAAETYVQGPRAAPAIATAIGDLCARGVDVLILARGGGSFEDLLPFSDERVVRAVAGCPVPTVSAVGHEQDTPLCDLAADVRASTPSVAGRLVVPDLAELRAWLERAHEGLGRGARGA